MHHVFRGGKQNLKAITSITFQNLIRRTYCSKQVNMSPTLEKLSSVKCFNGSLECYKHASSETKTDMKFAVFLPPQVALGKCPVVYWLSGLTCTEQNFIQKAGAQRVASELGLVIVAPDTSPRGCNIEGEDDSWDFGTGAGFYVDATEEKWRNNYRMYSYVTKELPSIINNTESFNVAADRQSIFGHSMGGHGALITALKNPGMYQSASAFAPICNPINCPWGVKAFSGYLGDNQETWKEYDASCLAQTYSGPKLEILSDQGDADGFFTQKQLLPENLVEACKGNASIELSSRMQAGYDHSYYFIATFVEEHLRFHARHLLK